MISEAYLIVYNSIWGILTLFVLYLLFREFVNSECWQTPVLSPKTFDTCQSFLFGYGGQRLSLIELTRDSTLFRLLFFCQLGSLLEVLHVALGIVRSQLVTTLMQISSRVFLVSILLFFPRILQSPEFTIMVLSWSITEIVRYTWYVTKLLNVTPYFLTWLRLSLFLVLYPLGVFGELSCLLRSLPALKQVYGSVGPFLMLLVISAYAPGLPMMYSHMIRQRSKTLNPRREKPIRGVAFPKTSETERSTMQTNKKIFELSVQHLDLSKQIRGERNWRKNYSKYVEAQVQASKSPEECLKIAKQGIAAMYDTFEFVKSDDDTCKIDESFAENSQSKFRVEVIEGRNKSDEKFSLPYGRSILERDDICDKVDDWCESGVLSQDVSRRVRHVMENEKAYSERLQQQDTIFVLFGAKSAMGPLEPLLNSGACVVPIVRRNEKSWADLRELTLKTSGTVLAPSLGGDLGIDILDETVELARFLCQIMEMPQFKKKTFVLGNYVYLDAADFVRISLAVDRVTRSCLEFAKKLKVEVILCFLPSPTDVFLISDEIEFLREKLKTEQSSEFRLFCRLFKCRENDSRGISNGIVNEQGPNYALAKRLQHWRAIVSQEEENVKISSIVSPATRTESVLKNRIFALSYDSFHHFKPLEVFSLQTSKHLLFLNMLYDIFEDSPREHPMEIFWKSACHGGVFCMTHRMSEIGQPTVVLSVLQQYGLTFCLYTSVVLFFSWMV